MIEDLISNDNKDIDTQCKKFLQGKTPDMVHPVEKRETPRIMLPKEGLKFTNPNKARWITDLEEFNDREYQ